MAKKIPSQVRNLKELTDALKKYQYANEMGFQVGIVRAGYRLLQWSLDIVPMDTGFLRSTAKVIITGTGFKTIAKIVYSAYYSIWVHFRLDLAHGAEYNRKYAEEIASGRKHLRRPQEQALFIDTPLTERKKELIDIVREDMKTFAKEAKGQYRGRKRR